MEDIDLTPEQQEVYTKLHSLLSQLTETEQENTDFDRESVDVNPDDKLLDVDRCKNILRIHSKGVLMLFAVLSTTDPKELKKLLFWAGELEMAYVREDYSLVKDFEFTPGQPASSKQIGKPQRKPKKRMAPIVVKLFP